MNDYSVRLGDNGGGAPRFKFQWEAHSSADLEAWTHVYVDNVDIIRLQRGDHYEWIYSDEVVYLGSDSYAGWVYKDISAAKTHYTLVSAFCINPPYNYPALCVLLQGTNTIRVYATGGGANIKIRMLYRKN